MNRGYWNLHFDCTWVVVLLKGDTGTLWCEDSLGHPRSFGKGHSGGPSCWATYTAYYDADIVISFTFFLHLFFSPSLSPSEISQSDSLEKIEANAFDNLLNLSEM